jgi:hypothetical protein
LDVAIIDDVFIPCAIEGQMEQIQGGKDRSDSKEGEETDGNKRILKGDSSSKKPKNCDEGECTRKPTTTTGEGDEPLSDDELLA